MGRCTKGALSAVGRWALRPRLSAARARLRWAWVGLRIVVDAEETALVAMANVAAKLRVWSGAIRKPIDCFFLIEKSLRTAKI
jgi:hypothetical protein